MPLYQHIDVRPTLGRNVYVAPNATVIGDVHLGDESSIWFGCVLRGDVFPIRIGARTNIQDGSVIHVTQGLAATIVGDDVTVGHMALLHGCTVGNRTLIGMGSILLDGAVVGDECLVAAGSLVPPRAVIPARSFAVGRPAKVVRTLSDDDVAMMLQARSLYVGYAKTFREDVHVVEPVDVPVSGIPD